MKNFILLPLIFCFVICDAKEPLVPESVLNTWGYETVEKKSGRLHIKRIKGEKTRGEKYYYPRFYLGESRFESKGLLQEQLELNKKNKQKDPFVGTKSYDGDFILNNCLYFISTSARVTYLRFLPAVLDKYESYIKSRSTKP